MGGGDKRVVVVNPLAALRIRDSSLPVAVSPVVAVSPAPVVVENTFRHIFELKNKCEELLKIINEKSENSLEHVKRYDDITFAMLDLRRLVEKITPSTDDYAVKVKIIDDFNKKLVKEGIDSLEISRPSSPAPGSP